METISGVCTEFRYLLVRLGRQLHSHDCEGLIFVHKIPDPPGGKCDVGLHALSSLESMGFFDPFSPEKLQEILSKIGRKDLSDDVREYQQSALFKKAVKLEKKRDKDGERENAFDERRVAAKLLSGAENAVYQEERRWGDMFAMALAQMVQLVKQTELLRKTIEAHGDSEQTNRSIEEALHSILTAQDEVESLSRTLKKAVSAAGLRSRRANVLDSEETDGAAIAECQSKKRPSQSPKLRGRERTHSYDGTGKSSVTKPLNTSSLCTASSATTELCPIPILPTQAASSSVSVPTFASNPSSTMPIPTPSTLATSIPKVDPALSPKPASSPHSPLTRNSSTPIAHKTGQTPAPKPSSPSPPTRTSSIPGPDPSPKPTLSPPSRTSSILTAGPAFSSSSMPVPAVSPSTLTRTFSMPTKPRAGPAPSTKPKPTTRTPDFHRKLESLLAEGVTKSALPTSMPHSSTFPSFGTLASGQESTDTGYSTAEPSSTLSSYSTIAFSTLGSSSTGSYPTAGSTPFSTLGGSSTAEPTSTTLPSDFDNEEHIYDDPNLSKQGESDGLYMNCQMVCNSAEYMNAKGLAKQESEISIQVDSGLGSEDKSWGGELISMKGKPHYMNLKILEDGYVGLQGPSVTPTTGVEYTEIKTTPPGSMTTKQCH